MGTDPVYFLIIQVRRDAHRLRSLLTAAACARGSCQGSLLAGTAIAPIAPMILPFQGDAGTLPRMPTGFSGKVMMPCCPTATDRPKAYSAAEQTARTSLVPGQYRMASCVPSSSQIDELAREPTIVKQCAHYFSRL